jgi:hypothetical protein
MCCFSMHCYQEALCANVLIYRVDVHRVFAQRDGPPC